MIVLQLYFHLGIGYCFANRSPLVTSLLRFAVINSCEQPVSRVKKIHEKCLSKLMTLLWQRGHSLQRLRELLSVSTEDNFHSYFSVLTLNLWLALYSNWNAIMRMRTRWRLLWLDDNNTIGLLMTMRHALTVEGNGDAVCRLWAKWRHVLVPFQSDCDKETHNV